MIRAFLLSLFLTSYAVAQIKIGAIASLQGPATEHGTNWLEGAQLAAEDLTAKGVPVKLIIEDDSTNPGKAATAFNKLSKADRVQGVLGGTWDFLGEVIYPLALRDRIPLVTPSNPKEVLSDAAKKNPYVFTNGLSLAAEEKVIEAYLEKLKLPTIGFVRVQNAWAQAHSDMVKRIATKLGMKVTAETEVSMDEAQTVYKAAAQKLSRTKPEVVYLLADYSALDLFLAEVQNFNWQPVVIESQHVAGAFEFSGKNQLRYASVIGVYPKYDDNGFVAKFTERFKHAPGVFAAEGYDALQFLATAIAAKVPFGDPSAAFVVDGLKGRMRLPTSDRSLLEDRAVLVRFRNGNREEMPDGQ